jgi:hypothetical protein
MGDPKEPRLEPTETLVDDGVPASGRIMVMWEGGAVARELPASGK